MNNIVEAIESEIARQAPELRNLFAVIQSEAKFGYELIKKDLEALPPDAIILEVGGGTMLLSCYLSTLGYNITSVEPTGNGFSVFSKLREIILSCCTQHPKIIETEIENFEEKNKFDFSYSINVMEHVYNVSKALTSIERALKPGGTYRFFCPNYLFPYEPHFNIPTVFTKAWTERLFRKKIHNHPMLDPIGVWTSINWITTRVVKQHYKKRPKFSLEFNRDIFSDMLTRAMEDEEFSARRSNFILYGIKLGLKLKLHNLCKFAPLAFMPAIDCKVYKKI